MHSKILTQLLKKRFCVLGAANSGISAALLLKQHQAHVFVSEFKTISLEIKQRLKKHDIALEENGHNIATICAEYDVLVVSPGIAPSSNIIIEAKKNNLIIMSEIELALYFIDSRIKLIGITGTNGKSTTTHYCAHLFNSGGLKTFSCGNIGLPLSEVVRVQENFDALCIELSSYQLEYNLPNIFDVSIFLNLQNDHLERHKTSENYLKAKWNLVLATKDNGICIIDKNVLEFAKKLSLPFPKCSIISDFTHLQETELCLPGAHNLINMNGASIAGKFLGISKEIILKEARKSTSTYEPLAHRLENVPTTLKQIFINDSKATNVESTLVALQSFHQPVHLLLGGVPKGDSYLALKPFFNHPIVFVYPFGEAGTKIYNELKEFASFLVKPSHDMLSAAQHALQKSKPEEIILLSPACSSFDEFNNFEHRGEVFKEWVKSL